MSSSIGLHAGDRRVAAPAFVGREHELAAVTAALGNGPALVVIEGEPGIGKTRLVHEALASLADRTVLVATCPPLREPFPLGPVVDGIRRLRPEIVRAGWRPVSGALRPLFPEWADQLPPALAALDSARETRHRLFRALTEFVQRLGVAALVVEDAHWADDATLELLLTLAAAGDCGSSLLVTYRPAEVPEGSLLLRLTSRTPAGMSRVRIELGPLVAAETRQLVGSMVGADRVSEEFAAFLYARTDGVPLAVEECVRLLRDRHDRALHTGRWTPRLLDEIEVPPTVRDSVLERVARLTAGARRVLEAAAVLAVPADEAVLSEVAELRGQTGRQPVAVALASGLLREASPGKFGFRHTLDAQAVGEAIPASRRRRMHGRAARALQRREPDAVERLSRHCREAGDTAAWCGYAEASADLAVQSGDNRNAVTMLLALLTTVEQPIERRVRLARKLGEAACFGMAALGDLADQVAAALRQVLEDTQLAPADRGELRVLLGRMLWRAGRHRAAFEELQASTPDLGHRSELASLVMGNLALPLTPDWPAAQHLRWLQRATELRDQTESALARVGVTICRVTALLLLGDETGWRAATELMQSAVAPGEQQRVLAAGLLNAADAGLVWGRYEDTRRQLATAAAHIQETGTVHQRLVDSVRVANAYLAWYTGAWHGLGDAVADLAASEETELHEKVLARQIRGLLDLVAGARASAERGLREVADGYARLGVAEPVAVLPLAALGRLRLADEAPEAALRLTAPQVELIARKGVWLWLADLAPVHVDALLRTGRRAEAEALVAEFAAGLTGRHAPSPAAALVACRARLLESGGDQRAAAERFAAAAAAWAALPRPYDELLALECQGRCLLAAGEPGPGLAVLTDAQVRLRELGARWDANRVARLLRRHGVEVPRPWRRGPRGYGEQLSPREREVLALIARGMTNREVGQVLFLSHRTVGRHLSTAMRKLGVPTRTAAAMAAAEAGLIPTDKVSTQ